MNPATKAETAPGQTQNNKEIRTPEGDHRQLIKGVVPSVNKTMPTIVPRFTEAQAMPAAAQPIPSDNAGHIQAGISEEPEFSGADIIHTAKIGRSLITGESVWRRISRGTKVANILRKRFKQKSKMGQEIGPDQSDIAA